MALEKINWNRTRTDEERELDKSIVISVRLNKAEDKELIDWFKEAFDVKSDSTMMKMIMHMFFVRLQWDFSPRYIKLLLKKERNRLSDYQKETKELMKNVGVSIRRN